MRMLDPRFQPSLESLIERMGLEISARAVILLHENGQVLHRHGWIEESEFPAMAALVAAMIATGKSLGGLGESFSSGPSRFACDSDEVGLYMVAVGEGVWLAALYDQPMNPGQLRMKVRRYAETCARLGAEVLDQWELPAPAQSPSRPAGATLPPVRAAVSPILEKITEDDSSLFTNITDDEIDRLFDDARS
jgi:predicted regulator of Ras-like GTPase activity (Roadblock/LC7/MglB family)